MTMQVIMTKEGTPIIEVDDLVPNIIEFMNKDVILEEAPKVCTTMST